MNNTSDAQLSVGRKIYFVFWILIVPVLLFWSAGTVRWVEGWVYTAAHVVYLAAIGAILRKHDPALLKERLSPPVQAGQPLYDRIFWLLFFPTVFAWLAIPGLDAERFGWSRAPLWVEIVGGVLLVASYLMLLFVFRSNTFLAPNVRLQEERQQVVVDSGPYGIVRHPMYAGLGLLFIATAALLGSYVGLGIAWLLVAMLAVRCVFEEGTLVRGLEGYAEYRTRVRYRIIPGIW